jgi:hypothetical protein
MRGFGGSPSIVVVLPPAARNLPPAQRLHHRDPRHHRIGASLAMLSFQQERLHRCA